MADNPQNKTQGVTETNDRVADYPDSSSEQKSLVDLTSEDSNKAYQAMIGRNNVNDLVPTVESTVADTYNQITAGNKDGDLPTSEQIKQFQKFIAANEQVTNTEPQHQAARHARMHLIEQLPSGSQELEMLTEALSKYPELAKNSPETKSFYGEAARSYAMTDNKFVEALKNAGGDPEKIWEYRILTPEQQASLADKFAPLREIESTIKEQKLLTDDQVQTLQDFVKANEQQPQDQISWSLAQYARIDLAKHFTAAGKTSEAIDQLTEIADLYPSRTKYGDYAKLAGQNYAIYDREFREQYTQALKHNQTRPAKAVQYPGSFDNYPDFNAHKTAKAQLDTALRERSPERLEKTIENAETGFQTLSDRLIAQQGRLNMVERLSRNNEKVEALNYLTETIQKYPELTRNQTFNSQTSRLHATKNAEFKQAYESVRATQTATNFAPTGYQSWRRRY
ncbi:MAG: hypothetical protein K2W82_13120 [Candidatus Obscuribacterales bacterium]|nr:hypothetical protein [Candidatus Obscuribacterales bacterium]